MNPYQAIGTNLSSLYGQSYSIPKPYEVYLFLFHMCRNWDLEVNCQLHRDFSAFLSIWVCIRVCVYVYVYIYVCMYTYIYIHMYACFKVTVKELLVMKWLTMLETEKWISNDQMELIRSSRVICFENKDILLT